MLSSMSDVTINELKELQTILDHSAVENAIKRGSTEEKDRLIKIGDDYILKILIFITYLTYMNSS